MESRSRTMPDDHESMIKVLYMVANEQQRVGRLEDSHVNATRGLVGASKNGNQERFAKLFRQRIKDLKKNIEYLIREAQAIEKKTSPKDRQPRMEADEKAMVLAEMAATYSFLPEEEKKAWVAQMRLMKGEGGEDGGGDNEVDDRSWTGRGLDALMTAFELGGEAEEAVTPRPTTKEEEGLSKKKKKKGKGGGGKK
jgi:hypothetical protein